MKQPVHPPNLPRIIQLFETIPHFKQLDMRIIALHHSHGQMQVSCTDSLVGNPKTGVIHGGVVTTLLDTLSGLVVMASVPENTSLATLDLRIDYLRPALSQKDLFGSAECYGVTESIAFVRGLAYQDSFRKPIANCTGTFMLGATGFTDKA